MKKDKKEPFEEVDEREVGPNSVVEIEVDRGGAESKHSKMVKDSMKKMGHAY